MPGQRVAIVDDEEPVRTALRHLFISTGFAVTAFASGAEFLASIQRENTPDCVVLDLHMAGLNGLDVLERLVTAGNHTPVIIITGKDEMGVSDQLIAAGATAYLTKPLNDRLLLDTVAGAIRKRDAGQLSHSMHHPGESVQ